MIEGRDDALQWNLSHCIRSLTVRGLAVFVSFSKTGRFLCFPLRSPGTVIPTSRHKTIITFIHLAMDVHSHFPQHTRLIQAIVRDKRWIPRPFRSHTLLGQHYEGEVTWEGSEYATVNVKEQDFKKRLGYMWREHASILRSELISLEKQLKADDEKPVEVQWTTLVGNGLQGYSRPWRCLNLKNIPSPVVTSMLSGLITGLAEV